LQVIALLIEHGMLLLELFVSGNLVSELVPQKDLGCLRRTLFEG